MTTAARTPQQDRSRATRRRLLEAAVECLAELGWNGSTVTVVAERAGVTRGAAQHHFPTREASSPRPSSTSPPSGWPPCGPTPRNCRRWARPAPRPWST